MVGLTAGIIADQFHWINNLKLNCLEFPLISFEANFMQESRVEKDISGLLFWGGIFIRSLQVLGPPSLMLCCSLYLISATEQGFSPPTYPDVRPQWDLTWCTALILNTAEWERHLFKVLTLREAKHLQRIFRNPCVVSLYHCPLIFSLASDMDYLGAMVTCPVTLGPCWPSGLLM